MTVTIINKANAAIRVYTEVSYVEACNGRVRFNDGFGDEQVFELCHDTVQFK